MDYINELHEMCETLCRKLKEANEKVRNEGGKLSASDMAYVDQLTHAIKSVKAVIAMAESEDDDGASYDGGPYRGYSRGGSYGRGRYAKRDSMGRYSSRGYSGDDDLIEELRDLMHEAPDPQTRQEMQRLIQKMERR